MTTQPKQKCAPWRLVKTSFGNWMVKAADTIICMRIDDEKTARLIAAALDMRQLLQEAFDDPDSEILGEAWNDAVGKILESTGGK